MPPTNAYTIVVTTKDCITGAKFSHDLVRVSSFILIKKMNQHEEAAIFEEKRFNLP